MDFDILSVLLKPGHNYIRIECRPHMRGYAGSVLFGGFGSRTRKNTYFARPVFESARGAGDAVLSEGLQFMKIESREELEHRKRNINYLLKVFDKEQFIIMEYVVREGGNVDTGALRSLPLESRQEIGRCMLDEEARLRRAIFSARIVNLCVLEKMFPRSDVRDVLRRMTVHFKGRFLLKNEFYEHKLQIIRKRVLDEMSRCGHLPFCEAQKIPQRFAFLLDEMCEKAEDGYVLRGHDEMLGMADEPLEISDTHTRIQRVLSSAGMASSHEIAVLSGLCRKEVTDALAEAPFVKLSNGCYVSCPDEPGSVRALIVGLFSKKASVRKGELLRTLREGLGRAAEMEEVLGVLETLCVQRAGSWVLKECK
ncbi:UNVERIFIED_CONTAM: hypothetical protein PYX00_011306 [Menopon gallinae]|uniref:Uncharacterized protein n=1 Tax=Menopon gallinae TaxID=328185 RepID=A0AAW2H7I3_9NEOP